MSGDKLILIADDQEGIRALLKEILEEDYTILEAESGAEAVEIVKERPVDLVILDIKMSGMSGLEALSLMKEAKSKIPVLMITGFDDPDILSQVMSRGAVGCLSKPFEIQEMLDKISLALKEGGMQTL